MSPLMIRVILDYYTRPNGTEETGAGTVIGELVEAGMLEENPDFRNGSVSPPVQYQVSEGGKLYCEALQAVPFPVKKWVMP